MTYEAGASAFALPETAISGQHSAFQNRSYSNENPSVPHSELRGTTHMSANGNTDRSIIGRRRNKSCMADEKNENQDWLAAQIARLPIAEVVAITGMTETAIGNVRRGKAKLNFDNSTAIFRAHPELGFAYMEYLGLIRPGEAEAAAAYTRFVNAAVRSRA